MFLQATSLLCIWEESVWLLLGSETPRRRSGRCVWVFLAPGRFAVKTPADEGWIVLDFLGFSRLNREFSMGYEARSGENFSCAFPHPKRRTGSPRSTPCGSAGLFMGQAYSIFCFSARDCRPLPTAGR